MGDNRPMPERVTRIEINGRWLSKPLTGTGRYSEEVSKALIAAGHDVVLWVPRDAVVPRWARGARVIRLRSRGQIFEQFALPIRTRGRILLSMGGPAPALKRRQVVVLHDATPFRMPQTYSRAFGAWYRILAALLVRRGATLATVSEFSANELSIVLAVPRNRIVIAAPAATVAASTRKPDVPLPDRFFLTVGTLAAHKNLVPIVSAFARADLAVVCVGVAGAAQVFAAAGLPDLPFVTTLGRVTDEELRWLYEHAQALLFPSLYEGFGLPAVEAQKAGCVVIASDTGPLSEVLGDSAVLLDPLEPAAFVAAGQALIDSGSLRAELRDAGHRNAERFTWMETGTVLSRTVRHAARSM